MKIIRAQKVATTRMVEVTAHELKTLKEKFDWISLGKFDIENSLNKGGVIGYLAGDIDYI